MTELTMLRAWPPDVVLLDLRMPRMDGRTFLAGVTTRLDIRTRIRSELNDSGGTALWASSLLDSFLLDALRAWSLEVPREVTWSTTSVGAGSVHTACRVRGGCACGASCRGVPAARAWP
jgi:hypothetical protein